MDCAHVYTKNITVTNPTGETDTITWLTVRGEGQYLPGGVMYAGQVWWRDPAALVSQRGPVPIQDPFWKSNHDSNGSLPALGWFAHDERYQATARAVRIEFSRALRIAELERQKMEDEENWQIPNWSGLPFNFFSLWGKNLTEEKGRKFVIGFTLDEVKKGLAEVGFTLQD